jgi:signal transduction histidine kinase
MSKLIQGLLLISKIENNQFLQTEEVRFDRLIDASFDHFAELIAHRKLTLTRDYQYPLAVKINPLLAEILITNLVSNAIRHNIMQGRIEVITKPGLLSITNTGQPLRSDPSELFKRFRKAGDNPDSVGLGLAIVQKITGLYKMRINYLNTNEMHVFQLFIE